MTLIEWFLKFVFWSWLGVTGVCLIDIALDLQKTTVAAYQKGPISARVFTRMLTEDSHDYHRKK